MNFHLQNNKELLIEEWPIINLKQLLTFVPNLVTLTNSRERNPFAITIVCPVLTILAYFTNVTT